MAQVVPPLKPELVRQGDGNPPTAVLLGSIMGPIGASVVYIAMPVTARDFGADPATIGWVPRAYPLVLGSLLLAFGWMGDIRGFKRVFWAGF